MSIGGSGVGFDEGEDEDDEDENDDDEDEDADEDADDAGEGEDENEEEEEDEVEGQVVVSRVVTLCASGELVEDWASSLGFGLRFADNGVLDRLDCSSGKILVESIDMLEMKSG